MNFLPAFLGAVCSHAHIYFLPLAYIFLILTHDNI